MVYGSRHRVKIVKNKMAPPFKEAEFVINSAGIDRDESIIEAAIGAGIITKSGAFLKMGEKVLAQGKEQLKETFMQDEKLRKHIVDELEKKEHKEINCNFKMDTEVSRLLNFAYFYLRFRPRTEDEMKKYLDKKAKKFSYTEQSVNKAIMKLVDQKLIDDKEFMTWFMEIRSSSKKISSVTKK